MKIVHIEDFFHPDAGYQLNILAKYLVKFGHEVTIVTAELDKIPDYLTSFFGKEGIDARDREYEQSYGVKIIRLPVKRYVSGRVIFTKQLMKTVKELTPDVLFIHGNDTFNGMWAAWKRKKLGCPLVMDSHMVDMASENKFRKLFRRFYRMTVTPIIKKENISVIRTADDAYVEKRLGIPLSQAPLITFGSDTMLCHPDAERRAAFRKENDISEDAFVVLYAGKLDEFKGGKLLAELTCQKMDVKKELVFVIVGNTVGEYGAEVEACFAKSPYRVLRFPTQKYCDLASFFQSADLALIPRQCSLSLYDMGACGLPVLAENNNINVERCSHGNGWTFEKENIEDFAKRLSEIANMEKGELENVSKNASAYILENYDYAKKAREYEREIIRAFEQAKS